MNTQIDRNTEVEIDLIEVMWELLSQWKAVLIAAIAMAVIVSGARYAADVRAFNEEQARKAELEKEASVPLEERIEKKLALLPDEERPPVEYAVSQQEWVNSQKSYLEDSLIMQSDTENQRVLLLSYKVDMKDGSPSEPLISHYNLYMHSEDMLSGLRKAIAPETEDNYIDELINYINYESPEYLLANASALNVSVVLPEDADADAVQKTVTETLRNHSRDIQSRSGSHTVSPVNASETRLCNTKASEARSSVMSSINSIQGMADNARTKMSEEQKAAFDSVIEIMNGAGADEAVTEDAQEETAPGFSKMYVLIGFILGIFAYACVYVVLLVVRGCVNSPSDVDRITGKRMLGEVRAPRSYKGAGALLCSRAVDELRYRNTEDRDVRIAGISASLASMCRYSDIDELAVLNMVKPEQDDNGVAAAVADALAGQGLSVRILDMRGAEEISDEAMMGIKNAAVVTGSRTKLADLGRLTSLSGIYGVNILGSIYVKA